MSPAGETRFVRPHLPGPLHHVWRLPVFTTIRAVCPYARGSRGAGSGFGVFRFVTLPGAEVALTL
jgi:hypothetical protein